MPFEVDFRRKIKIFEKVALPLPKAVQLFAFLRGYVKGVFKMSLTKKEIEFCRYFAICRDARESAAKAGFAFPERSGMRLLAKDSIISEIERISQKNTTVTSAVDGLKRIAFGSVADAVRLILEPEAVDTEKLDLFMVSELKCTDKCIEIKFFDRIKALTALLDVSSMSEDNTTSQFVDAIFKGASAIEGVGSLSDEL